MSVIKISIEPFVDEVGVSISVWQLLVGLRPKAVVETIRCGVGMGVRGDDESVGASIASNVAALPIGVALGESK